MVFWIRHLSDGIGPPVDPPKAKQGKPATR